MSSLIVFRAPIIKSKQLLPIPEKKEIQSQPAKIIFVLFN